jgi:hypothetical protein
LGQPKLTDQLVSRERIRQTVVGVVALTIWIVMLLSMSDFPSRAAAFPRFVLICLVAFSALHILTQLLGAYRDRGRSADVDNVAAAATDEPDDAGPIEITEVRGGIVKSRTARAAIFTVAVVIYVIAIPELGYLVSTLLFVVCALALVVGLRLRAMLACCIAVTALWAVATQLLELRLPVGLIG